MRAILMYHSVDRSGSPISVAPETLERHLAFFERAGVRVVGLDEIESAAGEAVALTFDDAFANFDDEAWPRLRERGMPVTLYVVTDHAGGTNAWGGRPAPGIPGLPLLDWDALARLAADGVDLGCHSRRHPHLDRVEPARLEEETAAAKALIASRTGRTPRSYAYPYGSWDDAARAAVAACFERACTTELRVLGEAEDPHLLPRLDAYYFQRPGRLEAWGSPAFRRRVAWRAWGRKIKGRLFGRPARNL